MLCYAAANSEDNVLGGNISVSQSSYIGTAVAMENYYCDSRPSATHLRNCGHTLHNNKHYILVTIILS